MGPSSKNSKKAKRKNKRDGGLSSSTKSIEANVSRQGADKLVEGEEFPYDSLHDFQIGRPCLSFDILRDSLGSERTEFPHTVYCVAGTKAEKSSGSYIALFKVSNISEKKSALVPNSRNVADTDMESEKNDESEDGGSGAPILQLRKVSHEGDVDCIRAMPQKPHICASWSSSKTVQVWDLSHHLSALDESTTESARGGSAVHKQAPLKKFRDHKAQGYALGWSPLAEGRLVSGDMKNNIYLWEPTDSAWNVDRTPFLGHTGFVKDLQWSPTEPFIFASGSADGAIAIWDTRMGRSPAISILANEFSIAWNGLDTFKLASGNDKGEFSIRDLRLIKGRDIPLRSFDYHEGPISSIEWSPDKPSTLAVSSSDDKLTIWDWCRNKNDEQVNAPPELLFVHKGQKDLDEVHWHPQIPRMLISIGEDGFNILMPSNI